MTPEHLAQTIEGEKQLLQTILREETDMLIKAVQEMGMITFADETQYLDWIKGFTRLPHRMTGTPEEKSPQNTYATSSSPWEWKM